jgi:hypothetical protein
LNGQLRESLPPSEGFPPCLVGNAPNTIVRHKPWLELRLNPIYLARTHGVSVVRARDDANPSEYLPVARTDLAPLPRLARLAVGLTDDGQSLAGLRAVADPSPGDEQSYFPLYRPARSMQPAVSISATTLRSGRDASSASTPQHLFPGRQSGTRDNSKKERRDHHEPDPHADRR